MKKILPILAVLAVIMSYTASSEPQFSPEMSGLFGDNEEADVIIILKDNYGILDENNNLSADYNPNFKDKKLMISGQQDRVIKSLNLMAREQESYDFELTNKYATVNGLAGKLTKSGYQKLRSNPDVDKIIKSGTMSIFLNESVPQVGANKAWNITQQNTNITGKGETICVVDTGIDYTHPNLGGCTKESFLAGTCSKVLAGHDFVNNDNDPMDDMGHGTHVAGIIASTNDTYRGVAPDANLAAVKVCDTFGNCDEKVIVAGIDWCVNNAQTYGISVISMSLGGGFFTAYCDDDPEEAAFKAAIDTAVSRKISVVVASGNDYSSSEIASPACLKNSTAVGSVTKQDIISDFSNRNSITDLLAPGGSGMEGGHITSTVPMGDCLICDPSGFDSISGTSMAAPHVSGAFALSRQLKRLQQDIILTPEQIENALKETGKKITDTSGKNGNRLVFPRIDIYAALSLLNRTVFTVPDEGKGLNITGVDVKINGRKSSNLKDNSKISKEAEPEASAEFKITVKNDFPAASSVEIENIKVKATIEGIDNGEDMESESKEFDLGPKDDKKVTLKFRLPLNVEEDSFDVLIEAEGEDENGNVYEKHIEIELEVEKKKHDLRLAGFELRPSVISCSRTVIANYKISNIGQEDEEESAFEITSSDLELNFAEKSLGIKSGAEGNILSKSARIGISDDIESGTYKLLASIYSDDGKLDDSKTAELKIEECVRTEEETDEEVVLLIAPEEPKKTAAKSEAKTVKAINAGSMPAKTKAKADTQTIKTSQKSGSKSNLGLIALSTFIIGVFFVFIVAAGLVKG